MTSSAKKLFKTLCRPLARRLLSSPFALKHLRGMLDVLNQRVNAAALPRAMNSTPACAELHFLKKRHPFCLAEPTYQSTDGHPWQHPFLTTANIRRFREYSQAVWDIALAYQRNRPGPLKIAFAVNMAQTMHKWAWLAQEHGAHVTLFPYPDDTNAISTPEWEIFDGEYADIHDGAGFLKAHPELKIEVPCRLVPWNDQGLASAYQQFVSGERAPLYRLLADAPGLRHELFTDHGGRLLYYFKWARELAAFDVIASASLPMAAYLSGRPYCGFTVGGDYQIDCGLANFHGEVVGLSFNAARFNLLSNPHPLGHSRRLGYVNGLYLPYPMDDHRYCPGTPHARREWEERYGPGVYVLAPSRIDNDVKGNGVTVLDTLLDVSRQRPQVRYVFLSWGNHARQLRQQVDSLGLGRNFIFLPPVGKKRLIDYYRSCDFVLDHFVWGYYGATALEAAAVGKPVVMMLRAEHYAPLYGGDVAPVVNAGDAPAIRSALLDLIDRPESRVERGRAMRDWLVRNHGARRTIPLLLALLRLTVDRVPLPADLDNPLLDPLSDAELQYHAACRAAA